jgi:hypothetical protein
MQKREIYSLLFSLSSMRPRGKEGNTTSPSFLVGLSVEKSDLVYVGVGARIEYSCVLPPLLCRFSSSLLSVTNGKIGKRRGRIGEVS